MNESDATPPSVPPADAHVGDDALYAALLKADKSESLAPLAAGLAQELNEVLARILGSITLARTQGGELGLIQAEDACLAARDLTRRIHGLAQNANGNAKAASPQQLLTDAAQVAGAGSVAQVTIDAPEPLHAVWVDAAAMTQALQNLVRNSIEAMSPPPPHPQVQLRATNTVLAEEQVAGLPAGDYVEFEVRDNGLGIAPDLLEKIWEPFFTTKKHGAGLGLPTTLAIVRKQGGQIGIDSALGQGTVFTVFLPKARPIGTVQANRTETTRFKTGRILIMDDDPDMRAMMEALLDSLDYRCDAARDSAEAVDLYRKYLDIGRAYDAVILDLRIPGGPGGEETFARLKFLDPDVRAIASSGGDGAVLAKRCLDAGFCGWLAKPYRREELGEALKSVLG